MRIVILTVTLFSFYLGIEAWAIADGVTYKVPLWKIQKSEDAQSECRNLAIKLRSQINEVEDVLGVDRGTVQIKIKTLVRGRSSTARYMDPLFSCAFDVRDTTDKLMISRKKKHNLFLKSEEIKNDSYCKNEMLEAIAGSKNVGVYRDLGVSFTQGDFCVVNYIHIDLRK